MALEVLISFLRGLLTNHDTPPGLPAPGRIQFAPGTGSSANSFYATASQQARRSRADSQKRWASGFERWSRKACWSFCNWSTKPHQLTDAGPSVRRTASVVATAWRPALRRSKTDRSPCICRGFHSAPSPVEAAPASSCSSFLERLSYSSRSPFSSTGVFNRPEASGRGRPQTKDSDRLG